MHIFKNFKSFSEARINLFSPLTVLIGPNGSGKSNLIEGIQLLSLIAEGISLHSITDLGQGGTTEIRGGIKGCARYGSESFELGFSALIKYGKKNEMRPFEYKVSISVVNEPKILKESLVFRDNGEIIFETVGNQSISSSDIRVKYNNFARGGQKPQASVSSSKSVLSQYEAFSLKQSRSDSAHELISAVRGYLSRSFIFDPEPKLMRNYERIGNSILHKNGSNISSVLYELSEKKEDEFKSIIELIKELPDKPYDNFNFVKTQLNDVIFSLIESGNTSSSKVLSDGTLRAIAVLAALETVSKNSRLVIEEFDNGLHPSRIKMIVDAIIDRSKERNFNVLLTTHNPVTLNDLPNDYLKFVYCAIRKNSEADCELVSLLDLPRYEELLSRGRLGDLVSEKILDQYFNDDFENNRKRELLKFLSEREKENE
jgi:predicted ATPase